jgi:hypothetical protein
MLQLQRLLTEQCPFSSYVEMEFGHCLSVVVWISLIIFIIHVDVESLQPAGTVVP